jgi:hypothetical protein
VTVITTISAHHHKNAVLSFDLLGLAQEKLKFAGSKYVTHFGKTRLNALRVKFHYLQQ